MTTKVKKTVTVDVPIRTAYDQWTQFEEFPQFMGGVKQVEQLDDKRLHWIAEIAGVRREWYATVLDQRPDEKVAWAATDGATNAGAVYFTSVGPGQTSVTLELEYEPEGLVEKVGDALSIVERQAQSDLEKFKTFIENRQTATGSWRGDVEGQTTGTPGTDSAASSEGDSGKAGISGKVAAAGVAAAAAGIAAVAASRSGSDEETDAAPTAPAAPVVPSESQMPEVDMVEETTYTAPVSDSGALSDDMYGTPAGTGEEILPGGVELDSTTPGITSEDDSQPQKGTL